MKKEPKYKYWICDDESIAPIGKKIRLHCECDTEFSPDDFNNVGKPYKRGQRTYPTNSTVCTKCGFNFRIYPAGLRKDQIKR